ADRGGRRLSDGSGGPQPAPDGARAHPGERSFGQIRACGAGARFHHLTGRIPPNGDTIMSVDAIINDLRERIKDRPVRADVQFDLGSDGVMLVKGSTTPPEISREDGPAEVTLRLSAADLQEILDGSLNPQMALMGGRLQVDGNMALAMQLADVLG